MPTSVPASPIVVHRHALVGATSRPARRSPPRPPRRSLGDVGAGIFIVELHRRVGFLLGEKLIQGLVVAGFLPLLRRRIALVQDVVDATVDEGVLLGKLIVVIGAVQTCRFFWLSGLLIVHLAWAQRCHTYDALMTEDFAVADVPFTHDPW